MAKVISQMMPNLAKVYLENTQAINVKGIPMSDIIESLEGLASWIEALR